MQPRYISAIEIGSSSIKGAVATVDPDTGVLTVIAREQTAAAGCVRYGWINNVEDTCRLIEELIDRLERNPRVAPRRIRAVYVALGGRSLRSSEHEVSLRLDDERKITGDTLARLSEDARESFVTDNEIVDIFPRRFVIDSGAITNPIGTYSKCLSATYNIVTCRPQMMRNLKRVFDALRSRIHMAGIVLRPLAEADLVLTSDDRRLGCALVDIGSDTTSVVVYKDGVLRYLAAIPVGSHHITRDITSLGVTIERAEAFKLNHGDAAEADPVQYNDPFAEQAGNVVRARAGEIVANIVANISYSGLRTADLPAGIVLVGGGSYLRNIDGLLMDESGMRVRRGRPDERVRVDATTAVAERSVDIFSALLAGAHINTGIMCLEDPTPPVVEQPERRTLDRDSAPQYRSAERQPSRYVADYSDDNDADLLQDDPDDEDKDIFDRPEPRRKKRSEEKPTKRGAFMQWLSNRASDLVKGPDED